MTALLSATVLVIFLWLAGSLLLYRRENNSVKAGIAFIICGLLIFAGYIGWLWLTMGRPPMRTMGETRMWYSLFLPLIGLLTWLRIRQKWLIVFGCLVASVFMLVNLIKPGNFDKTMMPALQSPWFVPHVLVYIFSYSLLAAAAIMSFRDMLSSGLSKDERKVLEIIVYTAFALLTTGMLFGALWARIAWGHYWSWDPKETWALISWFYYLVYIHIALRYPDDHKLKYRLLVGGVIFVLVCWFGVNYLPSTQSSIHVYD